MTCNNCEDNAVDVYNEEKIKDLAAYLKTHSVNEFKERLYINMCSTCRLSILHMCDRAEERTENK
jgi:hypothetical protein